MDRIAVFAEARTQIAQQLQITPCIAGALLTTDGDIQAEPFVNVVARLAVEGHKLPRVRPVKTCREIPGDAPHVSCLVISLNEGIPIVRLVAFHHLACGHEHLPQRVYVTRTSLVGIGEKPRALIVEDGETFE